MIINLALLKLFWSSWPAISTNQKSSTHEILPIPKKMSAVCRHHHIKWFWLLVLTQFQIHNGKEINTPNLESRRLARHARDEIQWPEGNKAHQRQEKLKYEEKQAREELHRLEYLQSKKLPSLQARATRVGNRYVDHITQISSCAFRITSTLFQILFTPPCFIF
jgi:hypothetical protein